MGMRYQLFSKQYSRSYWLTAGKPIGLAMRVADLSHWLQTVASNGFTDWYVFDDLKKVYVDPEMVKKLTGVTWVEGDGYPECPCCASFGCSMADHTHLPNCLAKKPPATPMEFLS
jgi:hypothetical protein